MLSEATRKLILATVPTLRAGGETLTKTFYGILMHDYPQAQSIFNMTHQAKGTQARALANAILKYAENIDSLDRLGPLVNGIVHKHVSLNILPEQYPWVGNSLLKALKKVLGPEVATPELIQAWSDAYDQLADILIKAEAKMYDEIEAAPGGWRGEREFTLVRKERESDEITSFYFAPVDGKEIVAYKPGQYITLRAFVDGREYRRNYSLSRCYRPGEYRISVKLEPNGIVSTFLHNKMQVGDNMALYPPAGEFTLVQDERPVVLLAGGVGITPLLAMTESLLNSKKMVTVVHFARPGARAFDDVLEKYAAEHPNLKIVRPNGQPTKEELARHVPVDAQVYFVGPHGFMKFVDNNLIEQGLPRERLHFEFFGPFQPSVVST